MVQTKKLSKKSKEMLDQGMVVSPLYDIVFKSILQAPRCRDYLIDLIHIITHISKEEMKRNLRIENSEHLVSHTNEKRKVSDMIVSIENNIINLEMNQEYYEGLLKKNEDYLFKLASESIHVGESYSSQKRVIQINFDHFWKYDHRTIVNFRMRDDTGHYQETPGEPIVESYHVNLAKIENKYYNKEEMTREEKLLLLLGMNQLESIEEISKGDYVMEEVKNKLVDLTEDANFIGLYDKEEADRRELIDRTRYAEKLGREKGLEEGRKEGHDSGFKEGQLKIARKMKEEHMDLDTIVRITGLSMEEIEKL